MRYTSQSRNKNRLGIDFEHESNKVLNKYVNRPTKKINPLAIGYRFSQTGFQVHPTMSPEVVDASRKNLFVQPSLITQEGAIKNPVDFAFQGIRDANNQGIVFTTDEQVMNFFGLEDTLGAKHFSATLRQNQDAIVKNLDWYFNSPESFLRHSDIASLFPVETPMNLRPETSLNIARMAAPSATQAHGTQQSLYSIDLMNRVHGQQQGPWNLFDTEWLGGPKNDFTSITEIAVRDSRTGISRASLVKPTKQANTIMNSIIQNIEGGGGITSDQRRYMMSLMQYSTEVSPFQGGQQAIFNADGSFQHATWLNQLDPSTDLSGYASHMRSGLKNLHGSSAIDGETAVRQLIKTFSETEFAVSYNALGSDVDTVTSYIQQVAKDSPTLAKDADELIRTIQNKKKHVDMYGIIANLYRNDQEQLWQDLLGTPVTEKVYEAVKSVTGLDKPGYFQQEVLDVLVDAANDPNLADNPVDAILRVQKEQAHQALVDINVLDKITQSKKLNQVLNDRAAKQKASSDVFLAAGANRFLPQPSFFVSEDTMQKGDIYYWHDGSLTKNAIVTAFDIDDDGRHVMLDSKADHGFRRGQFYEFEGFYEHEGYKSARFIDPSTNRIHFASFEDEMDLASYLHDHTVLIGDQKTLQEAHRVDPFLGQSEKKKAEFFFQAASEWADYNGTENLQDFLTRKAGAELPNSWINRFDQSYAHLNRLAHSLSINIDNITDDNLSHAINTDYFKFIEQDQFIMGELRSQSKAFRDDSARRSYSRLFEGDEKSFWRAKHFYSKVNEAINSNVDLSNMSTEEAARFLSWNEKIRLNKGFAESFLDMAPRLQQEADVYLPIIKSIEGHMGKDGSPMTRYADKRIASESLMRAQYLMFQELGITPEDLLETTERPLFRKYGVMLEDPFSGEITPIELRGAKRDPQSSLRGYISRMAKGFSEQAHKQDAARTFAVTETLNQLMHNKVIGKKTASRILNINGFGAQIDALSAELMSKVHGNASSRALVTLPDIVSTGIKPLQISLQERISKHGDMNEFLNRIALEAYQDTKGSYASRISKKGSQYTVNARNWIRRTEEDVSRFLPDNLKNIRNPNGVHDAIDGLLLRFQDKNMGISSSLFTQVTDGVETPLLLVGKTGSIDAAIRALERGDIDQARNYGAVLELPEVSLNGRMVGGRINQATIGVDGSGQLWATTLFEQAMEQLNSKAYQIKKQVAMGSYSHAELVFRGHKRRALEPISAGNLRPSEDIMDFTFNRMDNFTDIQKLYHYQVDDSLLDHVKQLYSIGLEDYDEFKDHMKIQARVREYLGEKGGIEIETGYSKHQWLGRFRFGLEESSTAGLLPYGHTVDISRPAYRQFGNFNAIQGEGRDYVVANGIIKNERFLPGTMAVTDQRMRYEGHFNNDIMPGVTVRYAQMTDHDIRSIVETLDEPMQEKFRSAFGKNLERLTTYEEQIIASEELGSIFIQQERKVFGKGSEQISELDPDFRKRVESGDPVVVRTGDVLGQTQHGEQVRFRGSSPASRGIFQSFGEDGTIEFIQETPLRSGSKVAIQGHKAVISGMLTPEMRQALGGADVIFMTKTSRAEQHLHAVGMINKFLLENRKELSNPKQRERLIAAMEQNGILLEGSKIGEDTRRRFEDGQAMPLLYVASNQRLDLQLVHRFLEGNNLPDRFSPIQTRENIAGRDIEFGLAEVRMLRQEETMRLTGPDNRTIDGFIDPKKKTAVAMGVRELQYLNMNAQPGLENYFESVRSIQSYLLDDVAWEDVIHENAQVRKVFDFTFRGIKDSEMQTIGIEKFDIISDAKLTSNHLRGTILDPTQTSAFILDLGDNLGLDPNEQLIGIAPSQLKSYTERSKQYPTLDVRKEKLRNIAKARDAILNHQNQNPNEVDQKGQLYDQRDRAQKVSGLRNAIKEYQDMINYDYNDYKGQVFESGRTRLAGSAYSRIHVLNSEMNEPTVMINRRMAEGLGLDPTSQKSQYAIVGANPSDRSSIQFAKVEVLDNDHLPEDQMIFTRSLAKVLGRDADGDQGWIHTLTSNYEEMARKKISASGQQVTGHNERIIAAAQYADQQQQSVLEALTKQRQEQVRTGKIQYMGVMESEMAGLMSDNDLNKMSATERLNEARRIRLEVDQDNILTVGSHTYDRVLANQLGQDATGVMRNIELKMLQLGSQIWEPGSTDMQQLMRTMDIMTQAAISGKKGEGTTNLHELVNAEHIRNKEAAIQAANKFGHETRSGVLMYHAFQSQDMNMIEEILTDIASKKSDYNIQPTRGLSIDDMSVPDMMGVLRRLRAETGDQWHDQSLLVSASKGKTNRRKLNAGNSAHRESIATLQQMRLTGVADSTMKQLIQAQEDFRRTVSNRSLRMDAPSPKPFLKSTMSQVGSSALTTLPFMAISAAFGAVLPKMMGSTPLSIDQRPQHDMAPGHDGSYVLNQPGVFGQTMPTEVQLMGEHSGHQGIQVRIAARDFQNLDPNQLSALVSRSIQESAQMNLTVNMNLRDSRKPMRDSDLERLLASML